MASSSNNSSFIPKRGTTKRKRNVRNGNVYILTIIAYVVLFATLLASGAIYLYQQYVNSQLQNEITQMNSAVSGFKEADMQKVQEFDVRLRQANQRLDNAASVSVILEALELSVIDTVRLSSLGIERDLDNSFLVKAEVETDNFDSTIFQRGVFARGSVVEVVEINDISLNEVTSVDTGGELQQSVSFSTRLSVPLNAVLYQPSVVQSTNVVPVLPPVESSEVDEVVELSEVENDDEDVNQEGI